MMEDKNSLLENEQKESFGKKAGKAIGTFFSNLAYDFVHAFKYNNMKLPAILFALPGLLIGFFISFHYEMIVNLPITYTDFQPVQEINISKNADGKYEFSLGDFLIYETVVGQETSKHVAINFVENESNKSEAVKFAAKYEMSSVGASSEHITTDFDYFRIELTDTQLSDGCYGASLGYSIKNDGEDSEVRSIQAKYRILENGKVEMHIQNGNKTKTVIPFDFSAISIFFLMLVSILNIFVALNLSQKKNLGTVVVATISTLIMFAFSATYFIAIMSSYNGIMSGLIVDTWEWTFPKIWAMLSVLISDVLALSGLILSWICYDRTYQKVDR